MKKINIPSPPLLFIIKKDLRPTTAFNLIKGNYSVQTPSDTNACVGWVSSIKRNPTIKTISIWLADVLGYGYRLTQATI
jgi:hypothetical protein